MARGVPIPAVGVAIMAHIVKRCAGGLVRCVSGWSAMQNCETPMASDRCRRLARLERRLADEQYSWANGRGLAIASGMGQSTP